MARVTQALIVADAVCSAGVGAFLLLFLQTGRGMRLDAYEVVIISQCLAMSVVLIAGLAMLLRHGCARVLAVVSLVVAYIVSGISLAAGGWAWETMMNAGSTCRPLTLGSYTMGEGDMPPLAVDPNAWTIEMVILTVVAVTVGRFVVAYSHYREPLEQKQEQD